MIKPPSLIKEYTLIYSGDPALALPADPKEREQALIVARETGNWQPLVVAGEQPTLFQCRPLPGTTFEWLVGEWGFRAKLGRKPTGAEGLLLTFQLGVRKIENFGGVPITFEDEADERLLSRDTTDLLIIAREMQKAGAGIRSLAEPFLDTTSDFAEIVFAILASPPSWNAAASSTAPHGAVPTPTPRASNSGASRSSPLTSSAKRSNGATWTAKRCAR